MEKITGKILLTLFIISLMAFAVGCKAGYNNDDMTDLSELEELETDDTGFEELETVEEVETDDTGFEELETVEETGYEEAPVEVEEAPVEVETEVEEAPVEVETEVVEPQASTKEVVVTEGETVSLQLKGTDPDGDEILYTFSAPLNADGNWETARGDAGVYEVDIVASDGKAQVTKTIQIEVLKANEPPVIEELADITIEEGESVSFQPSISDPDGNEVTYTISGWMDSLEKSTGYEDEGTYVVTVTATDGEYEVSKDFNVIVTDVNRAPDFDIVLG